MAEYIEREALVAEFAKGTIMSDDLYGMGLMAGMDFAMKKAVEILAADVAPVVHGRWKFIADDFCATAHCSNCGKGQGLYINGRSPEWNYCPNCGAKMDLEEENT